MGKSQNTGMIRNIKKKAINAAATIKAAIRDFLIKVNPGP